MNKTEREVWDIVVFRSRPTTYKRVLTDEETSVLAADLYIRKLERELQALKHKKAVAAILQKKV